MKVWKLSTNDYDYDEYDAFVVVAATEEDARRLVVESLFEPRQKATFGDPQQSTCAEVSQTNEAIILESYN